MRQSTQILSERIRLVGEAAKLNAEHVRLIQMAAGAQIATIDDADGVNPHQDELDAVTAKLQALDDEIAALDKELESQ